MDTLNKISKTSTSCNNQDGTAASCGVDCDEEGGEPPNIRLFNRKKYISKMTEGMRGLGNIKFAIMILLCIMSQTSADTDVGNIRGTITSNSSPHTIGNCSYECCLSFVDITDQYNHQDNHDEHMINNYVPSPRLLQEPFMPDAPAPCPTPKVGLPMWSQYLFIVILVAFSALFSGLTLGLMSLDPSGLEIVMANSDDPKLAAAAKAIYPVRLNGNLLLCTLLLGNVGVNSLLSILMADLTSGLVGFIVSTAVIVIFGEIIPQAICSRFALQIGKQTVPLVKVFIVLLYPICKPLSMILNKVLGHEIGTTYSTSEMAKLIEMHVSRGHLESATGAAMTGALRYRTVSVNEVMTPLVNTFMLSADERLGFDTVAKIFKTGYSRIPVYEVSHSNIIGLLFVKDLIFLDPEDEIPVKNFVQIFGRGLHVVWPDDKLGGVLKLLKSGRSHMALVRDVNDGEGKVDPYYEIKGIITLEDIIEIILGDEIVDETDELIDVNDPNSAVERNDTGEYIVGSVEKGIGGRESPVLVGGGVSDRGSARTIDWESRLRLLDERLVDEHLAPEEVRAVAAHLKTNYAKAVDLISDKQLKELLSLVPVSEICPASSCATEHGPGNDGSGVPSDSAELIYERGVKADFCTVVLSGKIVVLSGADKFRSDVSNWGVLASRALTDPEYVPDFSAWVLPNQNSSGGCRCVKLDKQSFDAAVDNTAVERTDPNKALWAMSTVVSTPTPMTPNGDIDISSTHKEPLVSIMKQSIASIVGVPDSPLQIPVTSGVPQTQDDAVHIDHSIPSSSYVQSITQKKTHSRRSKLLKAFTKATRKSETDSQK